MLRGQRFTSIHPRVWRCTDHVMTEADEVEAARLAMPPDAHVTGITRLRALGLEHGPRRPLHFVVARDHHIALDGIFLHRTKRLPPVDGDGVAVEAAFLAHCASSTTRTLDAIVVGDWLLHHGHMTQASLLELALAQPWRAGADQARYVVDHLEPRSRSIKESEARALLVFSGLPRPLSNAELLLDGGLVVAGDLVYRELGLLIEYEGAHHQADRRQYTVDIDRYAAIRESGLQYVQVTKERLRNPRRTVDDIHQRMVACGYDGPAPDVAGDLWRLLFLPLTTAVAERFERFAPGAQRRR